MSLFKTDRTADVSDPAKMLVADHQKVERIFSQLDDDSVAMRAGLVAQLTLELTRHMELEETIVYPFIRQNVPDGARMIVEADHEHGEAKRLLAQLEGSDPAADDFSDRLRALRKEVTHHVKEEERRILPALADTVGEARLGFLRGAMERAKFAAAARDLPTEEEGVIDVRTDAERLTSKRAVWVQPHHVDDDRWQVRREGASRASRVFDTQAEAIGFGRRVAQRDRVELVIAGRDGQIRQKDSAGQ